MEPTVPQPAAPAPQPPAPAVEQQQVTPPSQARFMSVESQSSKQLKLIIALSMLLIFGAVGAFLFMYAKSSSQAAGLYQYSRAKQAATAYNQQKAAPTMQPTAAPSSMAEAADPESLVVDDGTSDLQSLTMDMQGL